MFTKLYIKKLFICKLLMITICIIGFLTLAIFGISNIEQPGFCESEDYIKLPILMYHGLVKSARSRNKFMIDPELFKSDLEYIKANNMTCIFLKDLVEYVEGNASLPEKPIMLTFDDGFYNNYLYAYRTAQEYGFKIVVSPIGRCVDTYSQIKDEHEDYSYLTWSHVEEMVKSGLVEIQNHSYDMHSEKRGSLGCKKKKTETNKQYKERLTKDVQKQQELITSHIGYTPQGFVYPFGAYSKETPEILKELGFKCTFSCQSGVNKISKNKECLEKLHRFIRPHNISTKDFFEKTVKISY